MPDAYVIEVSGRTAGIVARDSQTTSFNFYSAVPRFNAIEGQRFSDPLAAERAARMLEEASRGAAHRFSDESRSALWHTAGSGLDGTRSAKSRLGVIASQSIATACRAGATHRKGNRF